MILEYRHEIEPVGSQFLGEFRLYPGGSLVRSAPFFISHEPSCEKLNPIPQLCPWLPISPVVRPRARPRSRLPALLLK